MIILVSGKFRIDTYHIQPQRNGSLGTHQKAKGGVLRRALGIVPC